MRKDRAQKQSPPPDEKESLALILIRGESKQPIRIAVDEI